MRKVMSDGKSLDTGSNELITKKIGAEARIVTGTKSLGGVKRQSLVNEPVDRPDLYVTDQQCVAIGRGLCDRFSGNHGSSAGPVVDNDWLVQPLTKLIAE